MKFKQTFIYFFIFTFFSLTESMAGKIEKAFERLKVYDYFNAKKYFENALENETAAAAYGLSRIYSSHDNPFYSPNEARKFILIVDSFYKVLSEKTKIYYSGFGINDSSIRKLNDFICEDAFERSNEKNTVEAYNFYLNNYNSCIQLQDAHVLRDSVAYENALKQNSSSAMKEFLMNYPESRQQQKAREKFEEQIYTEITKEKTALSFTNFIRNFPESPYRALAEHELFQLSVPDLKMDQYISFVRKYKDDVDTRQAWHDIHKLFMKDYTMDTYNNFKDSFPDYPFMEEFENDFRLQNYTFLPIIKNKEKEKYWGYINEFGKQMIEPVYEEASFFSEGLAVVGRNGNYGFINKSGDVVIDIMFHDAESFHNGAAIILKDTLYGLIDKVGNYVIPPMYDELTETSNGLYIASKNGLYGYIHKSGKSITPLEYEIAKDFKNGYAIVRRDEKYGIINQNGKFSVDPKFNEIVFLNDTLFKASNDDDRWGIINFRGDTVLSFDYTAIGDYSERRAIVAQNEKCGYIDENAKIIIPITFYYTSGLLNTAGFQNGYALLKQKTRSIIIDSKGKVLKFPGYEDYKLPSNGFIPVRKNKKWGYVYLNGRIHISCKFESAESFTDTLAIIRQNNVGGLIDTSGIVFIQPLYQEILLMKNAIRVKSDKLWGLLSPRGILYVPCKYSQIEILPGEIVQARDEFGFTYINLQTGKIIYSPQE